MVRSFTARPRLLISCLTLVALFLLAPTVAAAPPKFVAASGEWNIANQEVTVVTATPAVSILDVTTDLELTGTIEGTSVLDDRCVALASGVLHCTGTESFTGTIAGRSGTAEFHHTYRVTPDGAISGVFIALGGTGELTGVFGQGTFQGVGNTGTYNIDLIFVS